MEVCLTWQHLGVTLRWPDTLCGDKSSSSKPIAWRGKSTSAVFDATDDDDDDGGWFSMNQKMKKWEEKKLDEKWSLLSPVLTIWWSTFH